MEELKGLEKLNKSITNILLPFGISKAICYTEYSYNWEESYVTFPIIERSYGDLWFSSFIEERFGYEVKYPFIISLLHEVGHHATEDDITGFTLDFCTREKERISKEMLEVNTTEEARLLEWEYFNLPDEIAATAWAVKYATTFPKKVEKMWRKSLIALSTFYLENNLEIEY